MLSTPGFNAHNWPFGSDYHVGKPGCPIRTFSRFPKTRSPFTVDSPGSHANEPSPAPVASSGSDDLGRRMATKL